MIHQTTTRKFHHHLKMLKLQSSRKFVWCIGISQTKWRFISASKETKCEKTCYSFCNSVIVITNCKSGTIHRDAFENIDFYWKFEDTIVAKIYNNKLHGLKGTTFSISSYIIEFKDNCFSNAVSSVLSLYQVLLVLYKVDSIHNYKLRSIGRHNSLFLKYLYGILLFNLIIRISSYVFWN